MRVAVAGATGVLGRSVMPRLREAGHEVRGFARRPPAGADDLVALDLLDREAVVAFAAEWRPDAILHLATAIPARIDSRRAAEQFEPTNRLRTDGTRNLLAAADAAGGAWLVGQSIAFVNVPGEGLADEETPLRDDPGDVMTMAAAPVAELERLTLGTGGTVLRFGQFYGPGTAFARDGGMGAGAAAGKLPVVTRHGRSSVFSMINVDDAADAIVAVLRTGARGVFNVVDDDPASAAEILPVLAAALGGRQPRRVPAWLAKQVAGDYSVAFMTDLRGASNAKAKAELGWKPSIPSWREGFSGD
ncbi:MAG: NAD(P)-dependent oxidoreductase [Solirubrobacterales bacterium]